MSTLHSASGSERPARPHGTERANRNWPFNADDLDPAQLSAKARKMQAQTIVSLSASLIVWVRRLAEAPFKSLQRRRAIDNLRSLDDHLLSDIGLRRADIQMAVDGKLENRQDTQPHVHGFEKRVLPDAKSKPRPANSNRASKAAA